ncbi:HNH endonuclease [Massilia violaceinigra]|uniref:Putative HNH nuclease YajD n=1 Tax=Massilia violaceinigra TaxID=2045208 RepID=A0A2D2DJC7_9BURK|nr:HNH endonuclease signature motif containing protein [Massilia violaceinigra]ATQ75077.1 HNH endonuclease [Massilia violaceinigra]
MAWSKLSRQERGYGAAWDRVRKVVMERDGGLCQVCLKAGRYGVIAYAVDHIISKAKCAALRWSDARTDDPSNLQAICAPCHEVKTEAEQGKAKRPKVVIGIDGWSVTPE